MEAELNHLGRPIAVDEAAKLYTILELYRAFDKIFKEHLHGGIGVRSSVSWIESGMVGVSFEPYSWTASSWHMTGTQSSLTSWLTLRSLLEGGEASEQPMDSAVVTRMKQFRQSEQAEKARIKGYRRKLRIDRRNKGIETNVQSSTLSSSLLQWIDTNSTGKRTYTKPSHSSTKIIASLFITRDELKHSMTQYGMGDEQTIDEVLDDVDADKDGKINYDKFMNI
ncbi:calcium-dependent protein kinase 29 [Tanacetum coccineum]